MKMRNCGRVSFLLTLCLIVPQQAAATTALYSLSYGARSAGTAGATPASGGDALNQFLNPANLSFLPKRLVELGFSWIGWGTEDPFQTFQVKLDTPPDDFPSTLSAPLQWDDQYIHRIGTEYELTSDLTLRAGYSYASNPVSAPGAFLTLPAYGFQTLAVGMTWEMTENWDISLAFERAFPISVKTRAGTIDVFHANSQEDHNQYSAQLG